MKQWMSLIRRRVIVADIFMPCIYLDNRTLCFMLDIPTLIVHTKDYLNLSARAAQCQSDVCSRLCPGNTWEKLQSGPV